MYKLTKTTSILRLSDGAFIPVDQGNRDYREYLAWREAGNTPEPAMSLQEMKDEMWEKIKAYRDQRSEGGHLVNGKWFHSDAKSKTQQLGLVLAGTNVPPIAWKTMDGSFVTMTPALATAIFQTTIQREPEIFAVAEQHKAAMEASETPLDYDYTTGWPPIFGE